jgi:hypothetical protein
VLQARTRARPEAAAATSVPLVRLTRA